MTCHLSHRMEKVSTSNIFWEWSMSTQDTRRVRWQALASTPLRSNHSLVKQYLFICTLLIIFQSRLFQFCISRARGSRVHNRACSDLFRHGDVRQHKERQEDQVWCPDQPDWRHHGTSDRVLDNQWCGDCCLSLQVHHGASFQEASQGWTWKVRTIQG